MKQETREQLVERKRASGIALNGLSPLGLAGCVSGGRFIWRNPVYETLDGTHARTRDAYVCVVSISSVRREWTGNGPV